MEDIDSVWTSLYFKANSVRDHGTARRLPNQKTDVMFTQISGRLQGEI